MVAWSGHQERRVANKHDGQSRINPIGAGLNNLGNSCFMNSVLQVIMHTPPLWQYMTKRSHSQKCTKQGNAFCSACRLEQLSGKLFMRNTPQSIAPRAFADALPLIARGCRLGRQEDAHEFLRCLLEHLTKCFGAVPAPKLALNPNADGAGKPPKHTVVQNWFQGYLQSTICCLGCGAESNTVDPFLDLSLELHAADVGVCRSVVDAMRRFTKPEYLDGDNGYKCESCKRTCRAKKQFRIRKEPKILTIHLKRFSYSAGGGGGYGGGYGSGSGKISQHVAFDSEWDISPFMVAGTDGGSVTYKLYAVLVHEGSSTNSGHYYAYARSVPDTPGEIDLNKGSPRGGGGGNWFLFNDSHVRRASEWDVRNASGYILLYMKEGGAPPRRERRSSTQADEEEVEAETSEGGGSGGAFIGPSARPPLIGPSLGPMIGPPTRPTPVCKPCANGGGAHTAGSSNGGSSSNGGGGNAAGGGGGSWSGWTASNGAANGGTHGGAEASGAASRKRPREADQEELRKLHEERLAAIASCSGVVPAARGLSEKGADAPWKQLMLARLLPPSAPTVTAGGSSSSLSSSGSQPSEPLAWPVNGADTAGARVAISYGQAEWPDESPKKSNGSHAADAAANGGGEEGGGVLAEEMCAQSKALLKAARGSDWWARTRAELAQICERAHDECEQAPQTFGSDCKRRFDEMMNDQKAAWKGLGGALGRPMVEATQSRLNKVSKDALAELPASMPHLREPA